MARSKLELAKILVKLRNDDSTDPVELAKQMSLVKLCYEIQKIEEARENEPPAPPTEKPKKKKHILSWLLDSSDEE